MVTKQAIPCWKKMIKNNKGDDVVYQTGYLWWRKKYTAKEMLNHYEKNDKIWQDYVFSATLLIMDGGS